MKRKGFVLLETIVVTGVLGLLLTMLYPAYSYLLSVVKEKNFYDNIDYVYRTKLYNDTVTTQIENNNIKVICQNDCTSQTETNLEIKAAYLVNPQKIDLILKDSSILITTKRYLKYLSELDTTNMDSTYLVVAYSSELTEEDKYEYASIDVNLASYSGGSSSTTPVNSPTINKNLVTYLKSLVTSYNSSDYETIIKLTPPEDRSCNNHLAYDPTSDKNLRYVSENPCNYVWFNDEYWRIVGIMNKVYPNNTSTSSEVRVKLVRATPLGNYSWDSSASTVNSGWGVSDWAQADLNTELNVDYLNKKSGSTTWYNGRNNRKQGKYDYNKGLSTTAKNMISDARWKINLDNTPVYWTGKVALLNIEDYRFSVGDMGLLPHSGVAHFRKYCVEDQTMNYFGESHSRCSYSAWLRFGGYLWLLEKSLWNNADSLVTTIGETVNGHNVSQEEASYVEAVYPTVYLKSNVTVTQGSGTLADPYVLS